MGELKYYSFQDILEFIGFDWAFNEDNKHREYPFHRGKENVTFSWGQILIPKTGIAEIVQNKISDIKDKPIHSVKMMYQIPFTENETDKAGMINQNIKLEWRYDKQYKYGDITSSIYEVCYWILMHARTTNDFYIISDDMVQEFFSTCVIPNQWGLGCMDITSTCCERFGNSKVIY